MLINDYSTYEAWKHTEQPKGLRHALDTSNLNKYTGLQTCMCVRHVCRWIFMNATREILTVYKEGAYRPIGVCIFNRFCTFPSFRCEKLMKLFVFSFYSNSEYFYFFSATEEIFFFFFFLDRQCFHQTVSITNSLSYSILEAKSLWQQFGHHLDNLHIFWRNAVKYLSIIRLSYCAVRQNLLDWSLCSPLLKTER